jgi:hypothetical protein
MPVAVGCCSTLTIPTVPAGRVRLPLSTVRPCQRALHGFLQRGSKGQDIVMFDDPAKVRAMSMAEAQAGGVPDEAPAAIAKL